MVYSVSIQDIAGKAPEFVDCNGEAYKIYHIEDFGYKKDESQKIIDRLA